MKNTYYFAARAAVLVLVLIAASFKTSLRAQAPPGSLWYNGDFDFFNGLYNESSTGRDGYVFSDFNVTGPEWNITGVFSNNLASAPIPQAAYEIRSGVSSGNGGTLLFSGTAAATQVPTGRSGFGFTEYTVQISGLNIFLGPGTYWLSVAPIGGGFPYNTTTSGANAVGTPPGNNSNEFFRSRFFDYKYTPTNEVTSSHDFSNGVIGTVVPEPAALTLLGLGLSFVAFRRTKTKQIPP